jgi:hypothetical protein
MSDMESLSEEPAEFTVRDMNRHMAEVLAACDRLGVVRIKSRKGQTYELRAGAPAKRKKGTKPTYPDFAARRKAIGLPMMTKKQSELLDKLIAGE